MGVEDENNDFSVHTCSFHLIPSKTKIFGTSCHSHKGAGWFFYAYLDI